jgi:hypothetical protein
LQISPKFKKEPRIQQVKITCLNAQPTSKFGRLSYCTRARGLFQEIPRIKVFFVARTQQTKSLLTESPLFFEFSSINSTIYEIFRKHCLNKYLLKIERIASRLRPLVARSIKVITSLKAFHVHPRFDFGRRQRFAHLICRAPGQPPYTCGPNCGT